MNARRSPWSGVLAALASLLPACGETEPAATPDELVFGMVLVGPKDDRGWSQAHHEAGRYVEERLSGSRMVVEALLDDQPDVTLADVVAGQIGQGARLVFTTSDAFEEDTTAVAKEHPDTVFVNISGDHARTGEAPDNVGNIMGRMEDMKAIAGCAAALATQTGRIGYLGPLINHETRRLAASAFLGARHCYEHQRQLDPAGLTFEVRWIGFWFHIPGVTEDPTEVAEALYSDGADVVISGLDTTEGIVVAGRRAGEGERERVWAIPYEYAGACDEAPAVCLGVPYFNWGPAYLQTARAVQAGTWTSSWDWNPPHWDDLTDRDETHVGWVDGPGLTEDWRSTLHGFIGTLASGDVVVWKGPLHLQDGTPLLAEGEVATDEQVWYLPQLLQGMEGPSEADE